jgi:hypothetical protein
MPSGYTDYTPEGSLIKVYVKNGVLVNLLEDLTEAVRFHEEVLGSFGHEKIQPAVMVHDLEFMVSFNRAAMVIKVTKALREMPNPHMIYVVTIRLRATFGYDVMGSGSTVEEAREVAQSEVDRIAADFHRCLDYQGSKGLGAALSYESLER